MTQVTKQKNPGRVKAGKKLAERNKLKKLNKEISSTTTTTSNDNNNIMVYLVGGSVVLAGIAVLVKYSKTKTTTITEPETKIIEKSEDSKPQKRDPFIMK